jgi:hypothetical protein
MSIQSRRARTRVVLAITVILSLGCGSNEPRSAAWTVVVDSLPGGMRYVVNIPPSTGPQPTLMAEEQLRIGTRSIGGPESFGMIRQIAPLPEGAVAVLDGMAQEIRVFTAAGKHLRTFGGAGAGPGELRGAQGLLLGADGLLRVPEKENVRLSYFDPISGFVKSHRFYVHTTAGRGPWRAAMDSTGATAVWSSGPYQGGLWLIVRIYDRDMAQVDSIPYHDYSSELVEQSGGVWPVTAPNGMRGAVPIPFYRREQFVIDPTGQLWTTVEASSNLKVTRWKPAGDTLLIFESRRRPDPVSPAERDSAIQALEAPFSSWPAPPRFNHRQIPSTKPPAYSLSLDSQGRLWVRLSDPAADSTVYDIFDRGGGYAETVLVHDRVDPDIPPVVTADTLWAVVRDELDVQFVVRMGLVPTNVKPHARLGPAEASQRSSQKR